VSLDDLVESVFAKEGVTYGDKDTHPPIDQPTGAGGITLDSLHAFIAATASPLAPTIATLRLLTKETAAPIVRWQLQNLSTQARLDVIVFEPLRLQMIDFAYNSGPALAVRWLQRVLRVPRTGHIDEMTETALRNDDPWLVNQALVGARLQMIDMWTDSHAQAKAWEEGLESRGLSFSQLEVP
jgi:lysozyme family protein